MKDIVTQAYITYLHRMVEAHEEIRANQAEMIRLLEDQVNDLTSQVQTFQKLFDSLTSPAAPTFVQAE